MERVSLRQLIASGPARAAKVCLVSVGLVAALALSGCGAGSSAATVGGASVSESQVTEYIQQQREALGLSSDQDWANYLSYSGVTAESLRSSIAAYFSQQLLLDQQVKEAGFILTDEDVREAVNQDKLKYATGEEWEAFLKAQGMTEQDYVQNKKYLLECQLVADAGLVDVDSVSESGLLQTMSYYSLYYQGMPRTSQIQFKAQDAQLAQEVLNKINEGSLSFEQAARTYSIAPSASQGGDEGWIAFKYYSDEYQAAVSGLEKGQVSELVTDAAGIHIVKFTQTYASPDEAATVAAYPEQLSTAVQNSLSDSALTEAVTAWLAELSQEQVTITSMPSGLPYDVDPTEFASTEDDGEGDVAESSEQAYARDEDGNVIADDEELDGDVEIVEVEDEGDAGDEEEA